MIIDEVRCIDKQNIDVKDFLFDIEQYLKDEKLLQKKKHIKEWKYI